VYLKLARAFASSMGNTFSVQGILDSEGELRVTIPEPVRASADDLAPAGRFLGRIWVTSPPQAR
jgi:hypothetical protein